MKTMKIIITEQDKQMHDIHYICQGDASSKTKRKKRISTITGGFASNLRKGRTHETKPFGGLVILIAAMDLGIFSWTL